MKPELTLPSTGINNFLALASTSPTSTPPSLRFTRTAQSVRHPHQPIFSQRANPNSLGEQDPISLSGRIHTDVVLGILGVGQERLEDERVQGSRGLFDRARLARLFLDPVARDLVILVETEETGLASTLDELVGLGDELVCEGG
jgi:hypothetical protein